MILRNPDNPRDDALYESPLCQTLTIMERISRLTLYRDNGCWEYHGHVNTHGYPQIHYQDKRQLVSHVVWRIMKGRKIRKGFQLNHNCDNPRCYNPDHLYQGTQADNLRDLRERGAQTYFPRPLDQRKITEAQPIVMKRRFL